MVNVHFDALACENYGLMGCDYFLLAYPRFQGRLIYLEEGGGADLQNLCKWVLDYMASHPR